MKVWDVFLATAILLGAGTLFLQARGQSRTPPAPASATQAPSGPAKAVAPSGEMPAVGKKIFVERCAKCHNADGSAELSGGLPLNKRPLSDEQLRKNVNGRLKDYSEAERRSVFDYIQSFRKS